MKGKISLKLKWGFLPTPQILVLRNFKLNHSQAHQEDITYIYLILNSIPCQEDIQIYIRKLNMVKITDTPGKIIYFVKPKNTIINKI